VLASGTVVGQLLVVLASPALTRLYDPEGFGVLGVFVSLLSILGVVVGLRYPLAVPLPDTDEAASDALVLSVVSVAAVSSLFAVGTWLTRDWLVATFGLEPIGPYLWLLPVAVAVSGTYDALNYWAVRVKGFGAIARTRVTQGLATVVGQVVLGAVGLGAPGLVIGQAMGRASGLGVLLRLAAKTLRFDRSPGAIGRIRGTAGRFRQFPLFSTWSALANTLSVQLPVLFLTYFFDVAVAGLYALGTRVLLTPVTIVGTAVSQVFLSDAADASRRGVLGPATSRVFENLAGIAVGLGTIGVLAAPSAFTVVFGPEWTDAGTYAQLLMPWLVLVFVSSPLTVIPSVLGRQDVELVFNVGLLVARVLALSVGGLAGDPLLAIALYGGVSALIRGWLLLWTFRIAGIGAPSALSRFWSEAAKAVPYALPVVGALVLVLGPAREAAVLATALLGAALLGLGAWRRMRRARAASTVTEPVDGEAATREG